eukprot:jgi/Mesen1/7972/ME000422S07123
MCTIAVQYSLENPFSTISQNETSSGRPGALSVKRIIMPRCLLAFRSSKISVGPASSTIASEIPHALGMRSLAQRTGQIAKARALELQGEVQTWHHNSSKRRTCTCKAAATEYREVSQSEVQESRGASLADFTRFHSRGDGSTELQTAVVTYWKRGPWWDILRPEVQVDLVACVHIGDKEYFENLQEELDTYDRVLYEMVADKGDLADSKDGKLQRWRPPKLQKTSKRAGSIVGSIQRLMSQILQLDFQLECMDYSADNWYHADLDYATFKRLQKERGESFFSFAREMTAMSTKAVVRAASGFAPDLDPLRRSLLWAARFVPMPLVGLFLIEGVCAPSSTPLLKTPEVKALLNLDLATALKVVMAKQITLDTVDSAASVMESSVIIGERNRAAMEELEVALERGCRRMAIFYGSGHLPDLHRRLTEDLNLRPVAREWRTAWNITGKRREQKGALSKFLTKLARVSGWRLNRYQTTALFLFSAVLATDLWLWEVVLENAQEYTTGCVKVLVQFIDQGWDL